MKNGLSTKLFILSVIWLFAYEFSGVTIWLCLAAIAGIIGIVNYQPTKRQ